MDTHIKEIHDKITKIKAKLSKFTYALECLQLICKHDWQYEGHGHNSDFYSCSKCGLEKDD